MHISDVILFFFCQSHCFPPPQNLWKPQAPYSPLLFPNLWAQLAEVPSEEECPQSLDIFSSLLQCGTASFWTFSHSFDYFFLLPLLIMASALHSFCTILTHSSIHLFIHSGFTKDGISAWYPSRHRDTAAKRTNKAAFTELTPWEVETEHKYVHKFKIR